MRMGSTPLLCGSAVESGAASQSAPPKGTQRMANSITRAASGSTDSAERRKPNWLEDERTQIEPMLSFGFVSSAGYCGWFDDIECPACR